LLNAKSTRLFLALSYRISFIGVANGGVVVGDGIVTASIVVVAGVVVVIRGKLCFYTFANQ
jgi:hypothetical protein